MPTTVEHTIAPSGGDYTSISAWQSAQARDLVSADEIAIANCETFSGGLGDNFTITGWTTDATRYVHLRAAAGHEHGGVIQGGFYIKSFAAGQVIETGVADTVFENVDVENTRTGPGSHDGFSVNNNSLLINCIAKAPDATGFTSAGDTTPERHLVNCISYDSPSGFSFSARNSYLYNCLAVDNAAGSGFSDGGGSGTRAAYNCAALGNGTGFAGSWTGNNNASDDSTSPGSSPIDDLTSDAFNAYASDDFSHGDGQLVDVGADLTSALAALWYPVAANDIAGNARGATWDIGPFEEAGGGPSADILPQMMMHHGG